MEQLSLGVCMLLAFILGAYVRQPIQFSRKVIITPKKEPVKKEQEEKGIKLSQQEQFENMMNYTGKGKHEETE